MLLRVKPRVASGLGASVKSVANDGLNLALLCLSPDVLWRSGTPPVRPVIEIVDCEALQADHFRETVNDAGDVIKCVAKLAPRRHLRLAEAR